MNGCRGEESALLIQGVKDESQGKREVSYLPRLPAPFRKEAANTIVAASDHDLCRVGRREQTHRVQFGSFSPHALRRGSDALRGSLHHSPMTCESFLLPHPSLRVLYSHLPALVPFLSASSSPRSLPEDVRCAVRAIQPAAAVQAADTARSNSSARSACIASLAYTRVPLEPEYTAVRS